MVNHHKVTRSIASLVFVFSFILVFAGNNVHAATANDSAEVSKSSEVRLSENSNNLLANPIDDTLSTIQLSNSNLNVSNKLLKSKSNQIGSIVGNIYNSSGSLTITLPRSYWGVDVIVGTYDSQGTGLVDCYAVRPGGKPFLIGTIDARNDHTTCHFSYCPRGTYKFIFECTDGSTKLCYARMFNV